jgi:hypothetical protein
MFEQLDLLQPGAALVAANMQATCSKQSSYLATMRYILIMVQMCETCSAFL